MNYGLALLAGIIIGLSLGLLGAGGSILTVPALVYLVGESRKSAVAESLLIVGVVAGAAAIRYHHKRLIDWRIVVLMGVPGMLGAFEGAALSTLLNGHIQMFLFALVMVAAAGRMLTMVDRPDEFKPVRRAPWQPILVGIGIGFLTGLVGVGGGFLLIPALVVFLGLPMRNAVATSLVIIVANCAVGFLKQWAMADTSGVDLNWLAIALLGGFGVAGSVAGAAIAHRLPQARLRIAFGWVVALLAIVTLMVEASALVTSHGPSPDQPGQLAP